MKTIYAAWEDEQVSRDGSRVVPGWVLNLHVGCDFSFEPLPGKDGMKITGITQEGNEVHIGYAYPVQ